jgi:putative flavoprotein involved in K+ transport
VPGLYFLGLPWQHTRGSALLGFVADDAEHIVSCAGRTAAAQNIGRVPTPRGALDARPPSVRQ